VVPDQAFLFALSFQPELFCESMEPLLAAHSIPKRSCLHDIASPADD
jgi:hypothetical protein